MSDEKSIIPASLVERIGDHIKVQRWVLNADSNDPGPATIEQARVLRDFEDGRLLVWTIVLRGTIHYQLILGVRPVGGLTDYMAWKRSATLGVADGKLYYDATVDPDMALALLEVASDGSVKAQRVRPIGIDQSTTSLVYDEKYVLKIYRRIAPGANPDVEVTNGLYANGFRQIATPVCTWSEESNHLGFIQELKSGATDGWALALTSLRDIYSADSRGNGWTDPARAGGDFGGEARRLGETTAAMHEAMARSFGSSQSTSPWHGTIEGISQGFSQLSELLGPEIAEQSTEVINILSKVGDLGTAIRIHGDYHLGQVARADTGWFIMYFEGEPDRQPLRNSIFTSPLRDLAGMLRSFDYAAHFSLAERTLVEVQQLQQRSKAWADRNRVAFLEGYWSRAGANSLVTDNEADRDFGLLGFQLEKALYEVEYEMRHRPGWVAIPLAAVRRLVGRIVS